MFFFVYSFSFVQQNWSLLISVLKEVVVGSCTHRGFNKYLTISLIAGGSNTLLQEYEFKKDYTFLFLRKEILCCSNTNNTFFDVRYWKKKCCLQLLFCSYFSEQNKICERIQIVAKRKEKKREEGKRKETQTVIWFSQLTDKVILSFFVYMFFSLP